MNSSPCQKTLRDGVSAQVPAGQLVYAIGDVHGRSDLLAELLRKIKEDAAHEAPAKKILIFIGDYVDRGPDSRGVLDLLLNGLPDGFSAHFLKGNHEELLLDFLDDPRRLDHWRMNGGGQTMASYGADVEGLEETGASGEDWRDAFMDVLPPAHLDFLRRLSLQLRWGGYFFVHAGVRPGIPLDAQNEHDLLWIRTEFLETAEPFGAIVVHGHTPQPEPVVRDNRIGIDTGAVFTNRLTALKLRDGQRGFLRT